MHYTHQKLYRVIIQFVEGLASHSGCSLYLKARKLTKINMACTDGNTPEEKNLDGPWKFPLEVPFL